MEVNMQAIRTALQIAGFQVSESTVYLIGRIYKEVESKGAKVTLKDIEIIREETRITFQETK